jgi:hypothetical protein
MLVVGDLGISTSRVFPFAVQHKVCSTNIGFAARPSIECSVKPTRRRDSDIYLKDQLKDQPDILRRLIVPSTMEACY